MTVLQVRVSSFFTSKVRYVIALFIKFDHVDYYTIIQHNIPLVHRFVSLTGEDYNHCMSPPVCLSVHDNIV